MIILGVTGSIGMGKSTAGKLLERMGCPVHCSDVSVRNALKPYGKAFEKVALTFPESWDKKTRLLKKDVLSDIVFSNSEKKRKLENILHPIAQEEQSEFIFHQKKMGRDFCALDIPLLFETGADKRVDYTIVVTAPFFIQAQRVLNRKGMTEEKFHRILNTQMPDIEKRAHADFVVQTGLGKAYTHRALKTILNTLRSAEK